MGVLAVLMTAPRYFRTAAQFRGAHTGGFVLRRQDFGCEMGCRDVLIGPYEQSIGGIGGA